MKQIYNIDYVRFFLAYLVLFQHSFELGGYNYPIFHTLFGSKFAVDCFFILSGFLVFQSYDKEPILKNYFIKRIFRIYPAYLFTILFFIGVFLIVYPQISYQSIGKYLMAQLFFTNSIYPSINGVFDNNHFSIINGALWTLKIEILFYVSVPIIHFFYLKIGFLKVFLFLFLSSIIWDFALLLVSRNFVLPISIFHQYPTQIKYFSIGILIYKLVNSKIIHTSSLFLLFISLLIYILFYSLSLEENFLFRPILLSFILISIITLKFQLPKLNFDFSYGLYISHFPILQLLLSFSVYTHFNLLFIASLLVLVYAYIIWNLIEKTFMNYGKSLIKLKNI